jgi:hypothetical protein
MKVIIGKTFRNERVDLEKSAFQKCSFINCEIYADKGNFSLVNCNFSNCKLSLGKSAAAIAKLLRLSYPEMPLWNKGENQKNKHY